MTLAQFTRARSAFNVIELLVLLGIVGLLIAVAAPAVVEARDKARQVDCLSSLKQVGAGFRLWSESAWDFPMALSTNYGGTRETASEVWRTFQVMSNELGHPGVLWCQADSRRPATAWTELANSNLSYFVGLDADIAAPHALLAGDRHLDTGRRPQNLILKVRTNDVLRWTPAPHMAGGNVLFGDGSVRTMNDAQLQAHVTGLWKDHGDRLQNGAMRLALPE